MCCFVKLQQRQRGEDNWLFIKTKGTPQCLFDENDEEKNNNNNNNKNCALPEKFIKFNLENTWHSCSCAIKWLDCNWSFVCFKRKLFSAQFSYAILNSGIKLIQLLVGNIPKFWSQAISLWCETPPFNAASLRITFWGSVTPEHCNLNLHNFIYLRSLCNKMEL